MRKFSLVIVRHISRMKDTVDPLFPFDHCLCVISWDEAPKYPSKTTMHPCISFSHNQCTGVLSLCLMVKMGHDETFLRARVVDMQIFISRLQIL